MHFPALSFLWVVLLLGSASFASVSGQTDPTDFLGRTPGEAFTPHHRLVDYCEHVAAASPVAELIEYGTTPEGRPLQVLVFSSPQNLASLEALRLRHLDASSEADLGVVWLSYDVHGNEAVCTEAAIEIIGRLAAQEEPVNVWLEDLIILIDPCLNPDGHERYVQFFQREASSMPNADPFSSEHNEPWPGGRYNHYLFDLNRDWAWLTQVESQSRWDLYRRWMPHVHGDFHEMGYNSPYYFPPAVEPYHEVITEWQRAFQWEIGQATAANFDRRGETYYTDEDFDLFYPSYGDTYPMYHGAIGMTYEQGGSGGAGLLVERADGSLLSLAHRIENHVEGSWTLLETAHRLRGQLVTEFREYQRVNVAGEGLPYAGYLIPSADQEDLLPELLRFFDLHQIQAQQVGASSNRSILGHNYTTGFQEDVMPEAGDIWIPSAGQHARFLSVLMDPAPKLSDSLTYDITAWALPYAHGLQAFACMDPPLRLQELREASPASADLPSADYGWMLPATGPKLGRVLAAAFAEGLTPRMAQKDISWGGELQCPRGTPMFLIGDHPHVDLALKLQRVLAESGGTAMAIPGGMTPVGPDLGSEHVRTLRAPRIGLATGEGVSATSMGAVWWHLESQLHYPVTRIHWDDVDADALDELDVFVLPGGWYDASADAFDALSAFSREGGWIVSMGNGTDGLLRATNRGAPVGLEAEEETFVALEDEQRQRARGRIEGAVYVTETDPSHPLAWASPGPVFTLQNSSRRQNANLNGGQPAVWIQENDEPLAGFAGDRLTPVPEDLWVAGSLRNGAGGFLCFSDDPLFRGFWTSGQTLFNQAIFVAPSFLE